MVLNESHISETSKEKIANRIFEIEFNLLYKDPKDVKTTCEIKQEDGKIFIDFLADCGKFGADEMLDGYVLTPERLLQILQDRDDYTDDEL
jgi:hypothetical protein